MNMKDSYCDNLVQETAVALNEETVALMLLAVRSEEHTSELQSLV